MGKNCSLSFVHITDLTLLCILTVGVHIFLKHSCPHLGFGNDKKTFTIMTSLLSKKYEACDG